MPRKHVPSSEESQHQLHAAPQLVRAGNKRVAAGRRWLCSADLGDTALAFSRRWSLQPRPIGQLRLTLKDATLRPLFDLIRGADIAFTNLEVLPYDFVGDPALESGGSHFGAPAWVLDELTDAGFDLFAMASNHSLDYGVSGLLRAIEAMERRGLSFAGVGRNLEDARRAAYHTHPNGTVVLLSCTATFAKGQEAAVQRPRHARAARPQSVAL